MALPALYLSESQLPNQMSAAQYIPLSAIIPLFKNKFQNTEGWYKWLQKKTFEKRNVFLTTAK